VARDKLERALSAEALPARAAQRRTPVKDAPALSFETVRLATGERVDAVLERGEIGVLRDLSCAARRGLLLAAAGLEAVEAGRVTALGAAPSALRTGAIAYVGPFAPLVRGSVRRNLTLGVGGSSEDSQKRALQAAGLETLALRPGGLDSRIAENGADLSGRERARLTLARAFLARPDLLLVDAEELHFDGKSLERLIAKVRADGASLLISIGLDAQAFAVDCELALSTDGVVRKVAGCARPDDGEPPLHAPCKK
jgi:ABC-type transport system involved in cytochrome bd biosynthesis fused ATPase/permease subunit